MPSQSTERKKSWHSQTRLVCDRCCTLLNSFLNRAIVTTCPGLPYHFSSESSKFLHIDPAFRISTLWMKIRHQRPRQPPSTNFHPNKANVDILIHHISPPFLISKFWVKIIINDLENRRVPIFIRIKQIFTYQPTMLDPPFRIFVLIK